MFLFKLHSPALFSPAHLLAIEEALFDLAESSEHPGFLSFWEPSTSFVVLGYSKHLQSEVFESECDRLRIPILRRCSGGGTVLQSPGCFNYTLVLPIESAAELETITGANCHIMQKIHDALAPLTSACLRVQGHTDLTIDGLKFSGNAQRRKRRCLLFHGSFLLNCDLSLISKTLQLPRQQPEYRRNRCHESFLTNANLGRSAIQRALIDDWRAEEQSPPEIQREIAAMADVLVATKYSRDDWNRRF